MLKLACTTCGKDKNLSYCGNCNVAIYCSSVCQNKDHSVHKGECKVIKLSKEKYIGQPVDGDGVAVGEGDEAARAAQRALLKRKNEGLFLFLFDLKNKKISNRSR